MPRLSNPLRSASILAMAACLSFTLVSPTAAQEGETSSSITRTQQAKGGVPAWDIESKDFAADPEVVFGALPNGMRYALQRNAMPPGEAAIRFNVEVGSREETTEENGAAHFVEHMAFNGSTNIPEGDLLPILERIGLAFGADTNAETSLDYTTYKLALPNLQDETVDTALMVIREIAGELTFAPQAVERERGIILSEAQVRNNPQRRRAADYFGAALPESRLGDRITADVERIRNISATDLRAFYDAYYRPERSTLVMVGDFDVAEMERKIVTEFSDWEADGEARALYDGPIAGPDQPAFSNFVDPSIPEIIEIQRFSDWEPTVNTVPAQRGEVLRAIAAAALTNRINELSRAADSPTLGGQVAEQPVFRSAESYGLLVVAKDGQWRETLALAEQELRRARQYGFASAEIEEAKANIETALSNAVAQADGRSSAALAEGLVAASLSETVPTSPEADLAFYRAIEPGITAETVSEAFKQAWADGPTLIHVSTKQPIEGGVTTIAAALEGSAAMAVAPPAEAEAIEFAYDDWGTPGAVVFDDTIADLGIRTVRFANGLQLNLKTTDFEPGKIAFSMHVGSGLSDFPQDQAGLQELLPLAISTDGLEAHAPDDLRRALAGKQVSLALAGSNGALVSSGTTTSTDLDTQLDLLAARLTATAWRPETQAQLAGVAPVLIGNIRADPTQLFGSGFNAILAGNDARLGMEDVGQLAEVSLDDLREVVAPQLTEGPLTLGLVGDFDQDAAIEAVGASLGSLPAREVRRENQSATPPVSFAEHIEPVILTHEGQADQGVLSLSWKTDDGEDLQDDLTRDLLAAAIGLRLTEKLREELGATYSPQAFSYSQRTYDEFGHLTAFATVSPEAMDDVSEVMREIAQEMVEQPISSDLLDRARNPIREGFERSESQNSGWVGLVTTAQSDPELLDRRRRRSEILDAIAPADIQAVARTYLNDEDLVEIRVVPKGQSDASASVD